LGPDGGEGERRADKKKLVKRRRTGDRGPKLTLLNVNGTNVECQLETGKQKTVTFKFDCEDLVPCEIAKNLVCPSISIQFRETIPIGVRKYKNILSAVVTRYPEIFSRIFIRKYLLKW